VIAELDLLSLKIGFLASKIREAKNLCPPFSLLLSGEAGRRVLFLVVHCRALISNTLFDSGLQNFIIRHLGV
jgi:hypothetical protein